MINVHGPQRAECVVLFWANSIHHCWPIIAIHLLHWLVRICPRWSQLYDLLGSKSPQWLSHRHCYQACFPSPRLPTHRYTHLPLPHSKQKREIAWHFCFFPGLPAKFNIKYSLSSLINYWTLIEHWLWKSILVGSLGNIKMHKTWFLSSQSLILLVLIIHHLLKNWLNQLTKFYSPLCFST